MKLAKHTAVAALKKDVVKKVNKTRQMARRAFFETFTAVLKQMEDAEPVSESKSEIDQELADENKDEEVFDPEMRKPELIAEKLEALLYANFKGLDEEPNALYKNKFRSLQVFKLDVPVDHLNTFSKAINN